MPVAAAMRQGYVLFSPLAIKSTDQEREENT